MKKMYICTLLLASSLCAFAQGNKKLAKGAYLEPSKTLPYDYYSIGKPMVKVSLPLRYYNQYGTLGQYSLSISSDNGNESAIKIMCRILSQLPSYYMEIFDGYMATDTIPPSTEVFICAEDRSFMRSVDYIAKRLPSSMRKHCTVSVKKLYGRQKGRFIVMLPEDTKNILRLINSLPQDAVKTSSQADSMSVISNFIIHAEPAIIVTPRKTTPAYERGKVEIYYSLQNTAEKTMDAAVTATQKTLWNGDKNPHPTVSRYPVRMFSN